MNKRIYFNGLIVFFTLLVTFLITSCNSVYKVSFDSGFSESETLYVQSGNTICAPKEVCKSGYVFEGWYYNNGDGQERKWNFESDTVRSDVVLYAKWAPVKNRITLILNGGQCSVSYIDVLYGEEYHLPTPEFKGKYFYGWFLGNDRQYSGKWIGNIDITLEAKWLLFDPDNCPTFGTYEQDGVEENGKEPIEWIVLDENEYGYLLVSRFILDARMMESGNTHKSYKDCELRKWLNSSFYYEAFSSLERDLIIDTFIDDAGVSDGVFLLSFSEVNDYFYQPDFAGTVGTTYVQSSDLEKVHVKYDSWWLRNVFKKNVPYQTYLALICYGSYTGTTLGRDVYGVRPAIWVEKRAIDIDID